ncbi:MAG: DNA mismatch repair endonuclease MutH [Gammaproteobacteria bacterium]|nr:DNA mismatch repair endonuclease MutH [Gammaproteobacteria bacterium]
MINISPPSSEGELLARCREIEGLSFAGLAARLSLSIPTESLKRKGWVGGMIERALGTTAGTAAKPDFHHLGIELKTLPLGARGMPLESTFVTSINLLTIHQESWETSQCYSKLRRVLWLPIEGDKSISFSHRRIGRAFLWSADVKDTAILSKDWHDLSFMLGRGKLADVDARMGTYLQVRPKAANARSLCYGFDEEGHKILTLPRGFYLRPLFTQKMMI